MVETEQPLTEIEATESAIALSVATSKQVQPSELFDKYQGNISRELHKAIDRLEAIGQRRNQEVSMGSLVKAITNKGERISSLRQDCCTMPIYAQKYLCG